MTDEWARPEGERPPHDAIEIELDGPGGPPLGDAAAVSPPEHVTNWRRIVGLSSLAGVAVGVLVAVVVTTAGGDDDDESAPTTTLDPDAVSEITVPPTLPPVVDEPVLDPGPTEPTSQTLDLFRDPDELAIETSGLELPVFATIDHDAAPGEFELTVESMPGETDVRASVTIHQATGVPETVDAVYDAATGRMEMRSVDQPDVVFVIDPDGGSLYNTTNGSDWERAPATLVSDGIGMTLDEYLRSIVIGPLRASTFAASTVSPTRFVAGDDGEVLREYDVSIPTDALPEWGFFYDTAAFFADEPAGTNARFVVLVAADGTLRRTDGLNPTADGSAVLSSHQLGLDVEIEVELPPEDVVTELDLGLTSGGDLDAPEYLAVSESEFEWSDVDAALADFAPTDSVSTTRSLPDSTVIDRRQRSDDGRTRAFRQLTGPSPLAIIEQITDQVTGTTYARDEDDPEWRVVGGEPPLGVVDDSSFALLIDPDVLRSAGPSPTIALVIIDGDTTAHRASLLLDAADHDGATSSIADEAGIPGRPILVDVLLSDDGIVIGLRVIPFDGDPSFAVEQRFDDVEVTIDLPDVEG